jgi:hypothetical protein
MATAKSNKRKRKAPPKARSRRSLAKTGIRTRGGEAGPGTSDVSLYLYGITLQQRNSGPLRQKGVDGSANVEPLLCAGFTCWISRVSRAAFAEKISANMEDLDWLATTGVRHQRVVSELAQRSPVLPARFGTIFHSEESLAQNIGTRKRALLKSLLHVADADEWGIKVFMEKQPPAAVAPASSGSDYLRRKAVALHDEMQQRKRPRTLSVEVQRLAASLEQIALESAPAGKVSGGQPGLEWQISILLPRHRQQQFQALIERFSRLWQNQRRIEFTGPWPPYSFVKV